MFFANAGYRVIAHDRRSHGRSDQVWQNNTMDQYADDLGELIEQLDLKNVVLVGHSTGGGEVTRYVGRHGTDRVANVVLLGAVPPLMLKTEANPGGLPLEVFDDIRKNTFGNRSQFFKDIVVPFYNYNREGAVLSEGIRDNFWRQGMMGPPAPSFSARGSEGGYFRAPKVEAARGHRCASHVHNGFARRLGGASA